MIHETAIVEDGATIGSDSFVWAYTQVRAGARIGTETIIGSHSYIDADVVIGDRCKVQTGTRIFKGTTIEDGVFIGPGVIVTNDLRPRAITSRGERKGAEDWTITPTRVGRGASLGAGAIIVAGSDIGPFALVGAGATVTRPVLDHAIVVGTPARRIGWACHCGERLESTDDTWRCPTCLTTVSVPSP